MSNETSTILALALGAGGALLVQRWLRNEKPLKLPWNTNEVDAAEYRLSPCPSGPRSNGYALVH